MQLNATNCFQDRAEKIELLSQIQFCISLDEFCPFSIETSVRQTSSDFPTFFLEVRLKNEAGGKKYALRGKFWHLVTFLLIVEWLELLFEKIRLRLERQDNGFANAVFAKHCVPYECN